ncbi:hypothetical protein B0I35DRAFT_515720 [Stachybotrys elegans]|uniref:C2H2-type domain-containing protein n=1 Tax=Stachybotrys elegans TaxID=80388 RepID=A0A8K0SI17_9HYPO|nr:hypothetical protein B0I35DRAFT_515720 [Stachybotrys elegans]
MDFAIRDKVLDCAKLFKQAPVDSSELQDAQKRFREWSTNIGAHRTGAASLDERLRGAPHLRALALRTLDFLAMVLDVNNNQSSDSSDPPTENEALYDMLQNSITSRPTYVINAAIEILKGIDIRTPASTGRYAKANKVNVSHFCPADKSHIQGLFPAAEPILQDRLLQGVLSRRRFLQYTREYKEKLAREAPSQEDEERHESIFADAQSNSADTVTTPFLPDIDVNAVASIRMSDSDSIDAASDVSDLSVGVPSMPPMGRKGELFECPICFLMMETPNRKEWKSHVLSDMRPYVCTFTNCKEPDRLFSSQHGWYIHELDFHRRIWVCIPGCKKEFTSKSAFEVHLSADHTELKGTAEAEKHGAFDRQGPEPEESMCPMCGDIIRDPELVRTHIGRHQVQLGLWPLRSMRYFDDDKKDEHGADENDEDEMEDEQDKGEEDGSDPSTLTSAQPRPVLNHGDYTVGWICSSHTEFVAAVACLDTSHEAPGIIHIDENAYHFGQIENQNIVICRALAGIHGPVSTAIAVGVMLHNFPNMRIGLNVGIGGGAPSDNHDIRLGDVAVGYPSSSNSGRQLQEGFDVTGYMDRLPVILHSAVTALRARLEAEGSELEKDIQSILAKRPRLRRHYSRPDSTYDRLFSPTYIHTSDGPCELVCDVNYSVARLERNEEDDNPKVHYGLIASVDAVVKDAVARDKLAYEKGVICFETEANRVMDPFPCLVIRGICDYCDTHRSNEWQGYAAMSAAVYARTLLRLIPQSGN